MKDTLPNPLMATDAQLRMVISTARDVSCGNHAFHGNFIADALDGLSIIVNEDDPESRLSAAENLRDAAQSIIDRLEAGEVV